MRHLLVLLVACGGEDSLDCEYLASEENCWKTTATAAISCLPPAGEIGVLAADNASCTYASGHVIVFDEPLVLPLPNDFPWDFSVSQGGELCLEFSEPGDGFVLSVGGNTVTETVSGQRLSLTCPDGTTFENSNALELLSCPNSSFGDLPGNTTSSGDNSVSFALLNTGADTLPIFDCAR